MEFRPQPAQSQCSLKAELQTDYQVEVFGLAPGGKLAGKGRLTALSRPQKQHDGIRPEAAHNPGHQARPFDNFSHVCILSRDRSICKHEVQSEAGVN